MDEQYSISLGVILETDDLQRIRTQINSLELDPIKVQLDISQVKSQIANMRRELQGLGDSGGLRVDTRTLEAALDRVAVDIREIKTAFGSLDSKSGMSNLLTSINKISAALDNASNQFIELNAQLNSLAGKNFGVNIGLNMGGGNAVSRNASYGNIVRNETIPQLQKQVAALEGYLKRYYGIANEFSAVQKLIQGTGVATGINHPMVLLPQMADGSNLSKQMAAYKQYIALIKEAAALKGIDLSSVTSGFAQSADQLVTKAQNVQSGATEMEESFKRLQSLLGGGVDAEKLSAQLDSIVVDLGEIKTALQGLSQNNPLDALTASFNNLSASLEKLIGNATQAQTAISRVSNITGTGTGTGTQKAIQQQGKLAQTTTQTANTVSESAVKIQQAFNQMASASNLDPVNLRDDISETDELAAAIVRLKQLMTNINKLQVGQVSTSKGVQELQILESQLESLSAEWNETVAEINSKGGMGLPQMEQLRGKMETTAATIERLKGKIVDVKTQLASGIQANFGNYESQVVSLETRFNKLATKPSEVRAGIEALKQSLLTLKSADGTDAIILANENYKRVLKEVESQIRLNTAAEQQSNNTIALTQAKQNLSLKMSNWLKENSAAAKKFGAEIKNLQVQLNNCGNMAGVNQISQAFEGITLQAKQANAATLSFGDRLKKQFSQYSAYFSVYMVFMYAVMALRDMFDQVKAVDTAMTELKKVTNETSESYDRFLTNAASRAKELGTTIDGLVDSTADFARLGYGFEESQGLAEIANMYAVVGDEIEGVDEATKSLISTLAAFKEQQSGLSNEDFAMDIIDKFNEVGNNFAISSGGIGEALTRSASSLAAANNTLDESIALITAANTVVQNPEQVGTAFKTKFLNCLCVQKCA